MTGGNTPIIGLTSDTGHSGNLKGIAQEEFKLKRAYFDAVEQAGGLALLLPAHSQPSRANPYFKMIDGLILTGGYFDIDPALYGEKRRHRIDEVKPERTLMEIRVLKKAVRAGMPVLGICGGMQAINVAFGGSLYQDIAAQVKKPLKHEQKPKPVNKTSHLVRVDPKSRLARIAGADEIRVNSTHHQSVKELGKNLQACALANDGVVEAIEKVGDGFLMGVQWHPEQLAKTSDINLKILKRLVSESRKYRKLRLQE